MSGKVSVIQPRHDIIVVGGGLGGAAFAKTMAEHGVRVLVLERETQFKDRVRGETVHPWGVAETRALGIFDLLRSTCANAIPWWDQYVGPERVLHRDLIATTQYGMPELTFYHPAMQETLLRAAAEAGAEVRRGAYVRDVRGGARPEVTVEQNGEVATVQARLLVAADGRTSLARRWGGFEVRRDPKRLLLAGLLFDDMPAPVDTVRVSRTELGRGVLMFPQGHGRVRVYLVYQYVDRRLQGDADVSGFVAAVIRAGAPEDFFSDARPAGPLATFDGADTWVDHPYREGIALIGDAAAASDPSDGDGMSLTLRDIRVLRDVLGTSHDWDAAGHAYAAEHDRYYGVIHTVTGWHKDVFQDLTPEGDARRARALPLIQQDRMRVPDHIVGGPDLPFDETVRRRFFGEE